MIIKTQTVSIREHQYILHPSGALYWEKEKILLIADVHFGKVTHFRKHGSAVPIEILYENFERLNEVIAFFEPKSLYFLGDLFHSHLNNEWNLFEQWVKMQSVSIILITGNHDILSPVLYENIGIQLIKEFKYKGFLWTHHPTNSTTAYNIAGHIHPGIILKGLGKQRISVPCFHFSKNQLIVPAFGAFTGKFMITPLEDDIIYATADDEVIRIS